MQEQYNVIGEAAGKIYRVLEKNSSATFSTLQKTAQVSDSDLFHQAIGWLAREGKLEFQKKGKMIQVTLVASGVCCQ